MITEFGQQWWSYTNFRRSDRTLRSRDRILEFSQELVKICAATINFDFRISGMSGRYNQPVQYGRNSAHKSRAGWAVFSLGVYMTESQHIYEDMNEISSTSPGGSQQLEIPPSPNSKRAANFFQIRWYFTRGGDFNARQDSIVRLYFCQTPTFYKSANILYSRQWDANNLWICLILLLQVFVFIFSIYLCIWVCANIFGAIVLTLGLRLIL